LLGDVTGGASTAFWVAHPAVCSVAAPASGGPSAWRQRFEEACGRIGVNSQRAELNGDATFAGELAGGGPVLCLAGPTPAEPDAAQCLTRIFLARPDAIVLYLAVGRTGQSRELDALVAKCPAGGALRLVLLREISPFFASSEMALVHAAGDQVVLGILERLAALYEGNFQFLTLVNLAITAAAKSDFAMDGGANAGQTVAATPIANGQAQSYVQLVDRIRQQREDALPAESTVIVISKGDDDLVNVPGQTGWHFPQDEQGNYAGHNPADSDAAIAQLEALRSKGAQFIIIPATAGWWLEFYDDFRRHLEKNYNVLVCRPETCIIFDLRAGVERGVPAPAPMPYPQMVVEIRSLVAEIVPAEATVLAISKGDSQLLDLAGRRAWHFPQDEYGGYAGYHPADSAAAIEQLESLRGRGADYLLVPAAYRWWLEHYAAFANHLNARYQRVWDDRRCVIFRLRKGRLGLLRRSLRMLGGGDQERVERPKGD